MTKSSIASLLASTIVLGAAALVITPAAHAQGGIVKLVAPCFDDAAKKKQAELIMERDHFQHMLDAEQRSIPINQQALDQANAELARDLEYIRLGADSWPEGFQQADIDKVRKRINDLMVDIDQSQQHVVRLQATLAEIDAYLRYLSLLGPCPEPEVSMVSPPPRRSVVVAPPQQQLVVAPPQQVVVAPPQQVVVTPPLQQELVMPPSQQVVVDPPRVPVIPQTPVGNWPPAVDWLKPGPKGTTYEHHVDGSMVIRGAEGNVIGRIAPPVYSQTAAPSKPLSGVPVRNGQAMLDSVKTNPGTARMINAKTTPGAVSDVKGTTLTARHAVASAPRHAATSSAVSHGATRIAPTVRSNPGLSPAVTHAAPRIGGFNAGRTGTTMGRTGALGRKV